MARLFCAVTTFLMSPAAWPIPAMSVTNPTMPIPSVDRPFSIPPKAPDTMNPAKPARVVPRRSRPPPARPPRLPMAANP